MEADTARREGDFPPPKGEERNPYAQLVWLQGVFEFAPEAHLRTDGRGVILEANHASALLLGCPKEFLVGKPLGLFVAEGQRALFYATLTRLLRGSMGEAFECPVVRRGEGPRDVAVVVVPEFRDGSTHGRGKASFRWQLADVTDRNRAEAARDDLLRRLVTAQEGERRRVARELHDTFGQLLTALSLGVRAVRDTRNLPPEAAERLAAVERVVGDLHRAAHDLAVRLRPTALDDVGLCAALAQLAAEWSRRVGVPVTFEDAGAGAARFPPEVETAIYRVVQEAMTNVARHAGASRVGVMVGRRGGHAVAVVEDDGCGFDPEAPPPDPGGRRPLGLVGMRERVTLLGGTIEIESSPGGGTTVFARIPLPGGEVA